MKNKYEKRIEALYETMFPNDDKELNYFEKKRYVTVALKRQFEERIFAQQNKASRSERRQNDFLKTLRIRDKRENAEDERLEMEYSNVKYMKKFGHDIKQSILVNKTEAKDKGYSATFFTNTLLSRFQPFRTSRGNVKLPFEQWTVNPNFIYASLDEAIAEGYLYLNAFLSAFLHKVRKNSRKYRQLAKGIKYNIVLEPHRTLQVHSHGILFHHPDLTEWVKECFERTLHEFDMPEKTNDIKQNFDNIDGATKYIVKYIQKNLQIADTLNDEEKRPDWFEQQKTDIEVYLGWKMMLGDPAKIHRSSRNALDKKTSKIIYRVCSDAEGYKSEALKQAKKKGTCLRYEINRDTAKRTVILDGDERKIKDYNIDDKENKRFHVLEVKRKIYKKHDFRYGRSVEIDKDIYQPKKKKSLAHLNEGIERYIDNKITMSKIEAVKAEIRKIEETDRETTLKLFEEWDIFDTFDGKNPIVQNDETIARKEIVATNKKELKRLESLIEENFHQGYSVELLQVREYIDAQIKIPEEAMINNEFVVLSNLFKLEAELKKKISMIERLYFVYYKVEKLVVSDMGEKILYDKEWFS